MRYFLALTICLLISQSPANSALIKKYSIENLFRFLIEASDGCPISIGHYKDIEFKAEDIGLIDRAIPTSFQISKLFAEKYPLDPYGKKFNQTKAVFPFMHVRHGYRGPICALYAIIAPPHLKAEFTDAYESPTSNPMVPVDYLIGQFVEFQNRPEGLLHNMAPLSTIIVLFSRYTSRKFV